MSWENSMCLSIGKIFVHSLRQEEKYFIKSQWRLSFRLVVLKCSEPVFAEKKLGVHSWRWQTTRSCFALEPCHNHPGKAPLTPASGLPMSAQCPYPLLIQAWPPKSWPPPRCPVTTNSSCLVRCSLTRRSSKYRQAISFGPTFRTSWLPWKGEGHPPQFRVLGNSFPLLWISTNIAVDIFNQIGNYFQAQVALTPEEDKRRNNLVEGELNSMRGGTTVIQMSL